MPSYGQRRVLWSGAEHIREDIAEAVRRLNTDVERVLVAAGVRIGGDATVPVGGGPGDDVPLPGEGGGYLDELAVAESNPLNARDFVETMPLSDPMHWMDVRGG